MNRKNDVRIEKINRIKSQKAELDSMEDEKNLALKYIENERDSWILLNMLYYIELKENVEIYNQSVERLKASQDQLKEKKKLLKAKADENKEMMDEITALMKEIKKAE